MGQLIEGVWHDDEAVKAAGGRFQRADTQFRNWITPDGSARPDRRRRLQGRAGALPPLRLARLPVGAPHADLAQAQAAGGRDRRLRGALAHGRRRLGVRARDRAPPATRLHGRATSTRSTPRAQPDYTGRVIVPVLWDKERQTIVSNESAEIIRMLNSAFDAVGADARRLLSRRRCAPRSTRSTQRVYETVNNGVYKAGFATRQEAYEEAVDARCSRRWTTSRTRLAAQRYLVGDRITEADWRLFTTLVRFDRSTSATSSATCRRLVDYPHLWGYVRELYQMPGVAETVDLDHIKQHYYGSHATVNPTGIVPLGPLIDWEEPHGRG